MYCSITSKKVISAIIDKDMWEAVQLEIERKNLRWSMAFRNLSTRQSTIPLQVE